MSQFTDVDYDLSNYNLTIDVVFFCFLAKCDMKSISLKYSRSVIRISRLSIFSFTVSDIKISTALKCQNQLLLSSILLWVVACYLKLP